MDALVNDLELTANTFHAFVLQFRNAEGFEGNDLNGWRTSLVTNMEYMVRFVDLKTVPISCVMPNSCHSSTLPLTLQVISLSGQSEQ